MAKDRRDKARPKLDLESNAKRTGTTGASRSTTPSKRPAANRTGTPQRRSTSTGTRTSGAAKPTAAKRRKPKTARAVVVLRVVLATLVLCAIIFGIFVAKTLYDMMIPDSVEKKAPINPLTHEVTADELKEKQAFYLVGMIGDEATDDSLMMSLICHDKERNTVSVLELPNQLYLGKTEGWAVTTLDGIYASPRDLDWCDPCKMRLFEPMITVKDGVRVHNKEGCGSPVKPRAGSATGSLAEFVNNQLSLPVDAWFLMERETLAELIDCLGGVNIVFNDTITLNGKEYAPLYQTDDNDNTLKDANGNPILKPHIIGGTEAVEYMTDSDKPMWQRHYRQREVFAAVLDRMFRTGEESGFDVLNDDVIEEVMDNGHPLISAIPGSDTEDKSENITDVIQSLSKVDLDDWTVYPVAGDFTIDPDGGTEEVFVVNREQLLADLNKGFVPYSAKLQLADMTLPQNNVTTLYDWHMTEKFALDEYLVPQTDKLLEESTDTPVE